MQLQGPFIRDYINISIETTSTYSMFLLAPELIMMRRVFHLSIFKPPIDNVIFVANLRVQTVDVFVFVGLWNTISCFNL